ncbi:MAG: hypothetical protein LBV51_00805 [Acholeplasmatales bacterium]|jgi:hypothetical protein|nr:hypothetical protein [Acholeplasmatales bacterium]
MSKTTQQCFSALGGKQIMKNECYTREAEIENLLIFLEDYNLKDKIFWLPFDTINSFVYIYMVKYGYKVKISNLLEDKDFFNYEEENYDIILSNPPFTSRTKIFNRLESFNKPYIMIQPVQFFNNVSMCNLLAFSEGNKYQFILPDHRMGFITIKDNMLKDNTNTTLFNSFWLCKDMNFCAGKIFIPLKTTVSHKTVITYNIKSDATYKQELDLFNYEEGEIK